MLVNRKYGFLSFFRTDSKPAGDTLETTIEVPDGAGACAVCPWDDAEAETAMPATSISVSVCPWENEVDLPTSQLPAQPIASTSSARYKLCLRFDLNYILLTNLLLVE